MDWLKKYDLILLDFDGLLVDTEKVHFLAYETMLKNRGIDLNWSFERYRKSAHHKAEGLEEDITSEFPELKKISWETLYQEKRKALLDLYEKGEVSLMPGVEEFLNYLKEEDLKRAVVTHSDRGQVDLIKKALPILETIPNWITRKDYDRPKPSPDGYLKALELLGEEAKNTIGFEDTPRGLKALREAKIKSIMITEYTYPETDSIREEGIPIFKNFYVLKELKGF